MLDVAFRGKTLWASLVCFRSEGNVERLRVPLLSRHTPLSDNHKLLIDPKEITKWTNFVVRTEGEVEKVQAWKVGPHSLSMKRITNDCSTEHNSAGFLEATYWEAERSVGGRVYPRVTTL